MQVTTRDQTAGGPGAGNSAGIPRRIERWLDVYSDAAARIATVIVVGGVILALGVSAANVFTRYVLGFSIQGSDEIAAFSFLWVIWMGVSLAVRRGAVTVITFVTDRGPARWRRAVKNFSGLSLGILLAYCVIRSVQYAASPRALTDVSASLRIPRFYPIASMAVGYIFISLHYLRAVLAGAAEVAAKGRAGLREAAEGLVGGLVVGAVVWGIAWAILVGGGPELLALGVIFVALTLAGNPIIFMLSIVGIVSVAGFAGLEFYSNPDVLFPFRTTQEQMGLSGFTELIVVLMFLVVAEVLNASGMADKLIRFAATLVGHLRGGMAYVCQVTSAVVSGISGSAQADAAVMTPLLVPAMQKEGYPRDVAAAVVASASIKGPIGPISIVLIVYAVIVAGPAGPSVKDLLLSGVVAQILLLLFQAATVYLVVRRLGILGRQSFAGVRAAGRAGLAALPVLAIPVIILGGILRGVFTATEAGATAAIVAMLLALFWYGTLAPRDLPRVLTLAGIETGIVLLLVGDSQILAKTLQVNGFGQDLQDFLTGITENKYVFLLVVNVLLLLIGIFVEPLPALYIFAPFLAPIAVLPQYGFEIDPTHFGLIMVFNLVLALIHPPIGLVIFLVSSLSKVSVERLSITILPWLAVSLVVLFLVTYLPTRYVLVLANHPGPTVAALAGLVVLGLVVIMVVAWIRRPRRRVMAGGSE